MSEKQGYVVKQIPYFYQISVSGEQLDIMPDFWESQSKYYPNE